MAKRENRVRVIEHERRQIETLKTLDPIATRPSAMPLSNHLLDIAIEALLEARRLEENEPIDVKRLQRLVELVDKLPDKAQQRQAPKSDDD